MSHPTNKSEPTNWTIPGFGAPGSKAPNPVNFRKPVTFEEISFAVFFVGPVLTLFLILIFSAFF